MAQSSLSSADRDARITVLISGSGSNLQALINACGTPELPNAKIVRVISDRKGVRGLERAEQAGVPSTYHGVLPYKKQHPHPEDDKKQSDGARRAYDADLAKLVLQDEPEIVVCAGFMRILTPEFLNALAGANTPIINLHPALHGDLVGADCISRAWEEFQSGERKASGIMIHYVIAEVDMGEPIVQQEVSIEGCQSLEEYQERVHENEHPLIVRGTAKAFETLRAGKT